MLTSLQTSIPPSYCISANRIFYIQSKECWLVSLEAEAVSAFKFPLFWAKTQPNDSIKLFMLYYPEVYNIKYSPSLNPCLYDCNLVARWFPRTILLELQWKRQTITHFLMQVLWMALQNQPLFQAHAINNLHCSSECKYALVFANMVVSWAKQPASHRSITHCI